MKNIYMYVQDTMADFEHGYLMHALSLQAMLGEPKVKLLTVSKGKKSIKTAGGMRYCKYRCSIAYRRR